MIQYDPRNWIRVVLQFHGSVLPKLLPRIVFTAAIGQAAVSFNTQFSFKIAPVAHTMVGAALGLLLVFRTNASFDRWWEGRKLLGAMVNRSRDLTRQAVNLIDGDDDLARTARADLRELIAGFFALTRLHLRGERDLNPLENPSPRASARASNPSPTAPPSSSRGSPRASPASPASSASPSRACSSSTPTSPPCTTTSAGVSASSKPRSRSRTRSTSRPS